MARPRRQPQPHQQSESQPPPPVARAAEPAMPRRACPPADAETPEQARLADFLVALVGEKAHDDVDPESPEMAEYWEWKSKQARDALTPAERVALGRDARAFARRMREMLREQSPEIDRPDER